MTTTDRGTPRKVLDVKNLTVHYKTLQGDVQAVRDASFDLNSHEILGLIGESGCGKTTAASTILRLLPPPARIKDGTAILNGDKDLLQLTEDELREVRWRDIALIPQGAMNSLNPVMRISEQMGDGFRRQPGEEAKRQERRERSTELFGLVGLPARALHLYPHELSGGMKQRVCIAMALVNYPSLLVADEPTSALDVNVQRLVAQTLLDVKQELGTAIIVIGHDMGLMAQLADRVAVMYAGVVMEIGPVDKVLQNPDHPYTRLLMDAVPEIGKETRAVTTEGLTHDLRNPPAGCAFVDRCPAAQDKCREPVESIDRGDRHQVWCTRIGEIDVETMWTGGTE